MRYLYDLATLLALPTNLFRQQVITFWTFVENPSKGDYKNYGEWLQQSTNLSPELIEEGFVREIISKVQTMRKEADFDVMDHIAIYVQDNKRILSILNANEETIKNEVLAEHIQYGQVDGYTKEWNINGEKVMMGVKKLAL